jgi:hypothetical protein
MAATIVTSRKPALITTAALLTVAVLEGELASCGQYDGQGGNLQCVYSTFVENLKWMSSDCLSLGTTVGKCLARADLTPLVLDCMIDQWEMVEDQVLVVEQYCEAGVNLLWEDFPQILEVLKVNDAFYEAIRQIRSQVIFASCLPSIALVHQASHVYHACNSIWKYQQLYCK